MTDLEERFRGFDLPDPPAGQRERIRAAARRGRAHPWRVPLGLAAAIALAVLAYLGDEARHREALRALAAPPPVERIAIRAPVRRLLEEELKLWKF